MSHTPFIPTIHTIALLAAVASGCRQTSPPNILLIVVDALRADCVGRADTLTPTLDRLIAQGTLFRRAYSASSWTMPAIASLMTSRIPSQHRVIGFGNTLADHEITLPEVLHERDYLTAAFVGNRLLSPSLGFRQGFDVYQLTAPPKDGQSEAKPPARELNQAFLNWLDADARRSAPSQPYFVYLHYMETHSPFTSSPQATDRMMRRSGDLTAKKAVLSDLLFHHPERMARPDPEALQVIRDLYDAEVADMDEQLGELLQQLEKRNFTHNAVIVVTADHGEAFFEHGGMGHRGRLFEDVVRIPLIVWTSTGTRREVAAPVSSIDIGPTLVTVGGAKPPPSFQGRSLTADIGVGGVRERLAQWFGSGAAVPVYFEFFSTNPKRPKYQHGAVIDSRKLLIDSDGKTERFDLDADPGEKNPAGLSENDTRDLQKVLASHPLTLPAAGTPLDADTRERMRALGYGD